MTKILMLIYFPSKLYNFTSTVKPVLSSQGTVKITFEGWQLLHTDQSTIKMNTWEFKYWPLKTVGCLIQLTTHTGLIAFVQDSEDDNPPLLAHFTTAMFVLIYSNSL